MKNLILSFGAAALLLGGCGSSLKEKAPESGSIAERILAFQESIMAISVRSSSPAEAAAGVNKYCARNQAVFQRLSEDARALEGDFGAILKLTADLMKGIEDLAKRAENDMKGKEDIFGSEEVAEAVKRCNVAMPGVEQADEPVAEPPGGSEGGAPDTDGTIDSLE